MLFKKQFPFSMENLPRPKSCGCFSLRIGSIISALILILYSVFGVAQCLAALGLLSTADPDTASVNMISAALVISAALIHAVFLSLSALMLVGVLRDKVSLIVPWLVCMSIRVLVSMLLLIFWVTTGTVRNGHEHDFKFYILELSLLTANFYMLTVVSSYNQQLEENEEEILNLRMLRYSSDPIYTSSV